MCTYGQFPFVGIRRDRGKVEDAVGDVSWRTTTSADRGEAKRMVTAGIFINGDLGPLPGDIVTLDCDFIDRLHEQDKDAQAEFLEMMEWKMQGFDVHLA